jgi:hypothetical protein
MKINGNQIRPGNVIEHAGELWVAVKAQAVKPGKGPAYNQVELKSLNDGRKLNNRFGSDERVDVEPGERARAQEESLVDEPPEAESPSGDTAEEGSAENSTVTPQDRWDRQTTAGGVTVHRKRK